MPVKPSENEDRYVIELELKRRLEKAAEEQHAMAAEEKRRLKALHHMHCPKCGHKLHLEKYGDVEVDVCASCKGLWLDANELETIIASARANPFRSFLKTLGSVTK